MGLGGQIIELRMGKNKIMDLRNKTFCEILISLKKYGEQNAGELSLSTSKSYTTCFRGIKDLLELGLILKQPKTNKYVITEEKAINKEMELILKDTKIYLELKEVTDN